VAADPTRQALLDLGDPLLALAAMVVLVLVCYLASTRR
jgi:hypothetical protein